MDGFTYHNIFETKGIEYIIVISFLIILIPFWIMLNKKSKVALKIQQAFDVLTAGILRIPQGLFYSRSHTWSYLEKSGNAKIGLDDFLMQVVGDVKISHLKSPGDKLRKGEVVAEVEQNGKKLKITSPISGEIVKFNNIIEESPGIINQDPYDDGWIYKVKPSAWVSETKSYFMAEEAVNWFNKELERFKDFLSVTIGKYTTEPSMVALQEGGELRSKVLSGLDKDIWADFEEAFLKPEKEPEDE